MERIEALLQRLDKALQRARPEFYARLLPGATDEEIATLEEALGLAVPEDFKAFLRWKNGYDYRFQPPERTDCFINQFLILCHSEIIGLYELEKELHAKNSPPHKEGFQAPEWLSWSPLWIPFLDEDSTIYASYIDMGGAFNGEVGQILEAYSEQIFIMHKDFSKWVETITIAYEEDVISFEEDDLWDSFKQYDDLVKELNPGYPVIINRPNMPMNR